MSSEMSPLFRLAIASGRAETVKSHLARGADVNARDSSGAPALLLAASRGRQDICEILLEHGADPSVIDAGGRTVADYAVEWGFDLSSGGWTIPPDSRSNHDSPAEAEMRAEPESLTAALPDAESQHVAGLGYAAAASSGQVWVAAPQDKSLPEREPEPEPGLPTPILPGRASMQADTGAKATFETQQGAVEQGSLEEGWEADDELDGWEIEHESTAPEEDAVRAAAARSAHEVFSRASAVIDASDWSAVSASLPHVLTEEVRLLPRSVAALLSEGLAYGRMPVQRVRFALRSVRSTKEYGTSLRIVMSDLGIDVRSSLFEELLEDEAPAAAADDTYGDSLEEAADLLDVMLGRDAEAEYLAEVRSKREEAVSIQPILWTRAEELRRRASSAFAKMTGGLGFLEAGGASFSSKDEDLSAAADEVDEVLDDNGDPDAPAGAKITEAPEAPVGEHLSSIFTGMSDIAVTERLMDMRLPVSVMRNAAILAGQTGAEGANDLLSMLDELASRLDHIVETNLSLVTWLANRYRNRGLDYLDLVQEGNIGLMKAVQKFDPSRGVKMATYAIWWIRQAITRAISDTGRTIRLPVHVQDKAKKLDRVRETLRAETGSEPDAAITADRMEMSEDALVRLELNVGALMPDSGDNAERLAENAARNIADMSDSPEDEMWERKVRQEIFDLLLDLTPREERVVRMRFGIGMTDELTLEEVGETFEVTRERIRQIEAKALRRLSHPSRCRRLRGVLDVQ